MQKSRNRWISDIGHRLSVLLVCALSAAHGQSTSDIRRATSDSIAFYRALDLEGAGKYREAAVLFRQALHTSTGASALLGLERAYAELQWADSLLAPLDSLIRTNPREPIFRAVQLRTLQTLGHDTEMRDAFERWVNDAPRSADPYREYARLLLQRGQAQRADSILSRGHSPSTLFQISVAVAAG